MLDDPTSDLLGPANIVRNGELTCAPILVPKVFFPDKDRSRIMPVSIEPFATRSQALEDFVTQDLEYALFLADTDSTEALDTASHARDIATRARDIASKVIADVSRRDPNFGWQVAWVPAGWVDHSDRFGLMAGSRIQVADEWGQPRITIDVDHGETPVPWSLGPDHPPLSSAFLSYQPRTDIPGAAGVVQYPTGGAFRFSSLLSPAAAVDRLVDIPAVIRNTRGAWLNVSKVHERAWAFIESNFEPLIGARPKGEQAQAVWWNAVLNLEKASGPGVKETADDVLDRATYVDPALHDSLVNVAASLPSVREHLHGKGFAVEQMELLRSVDPGLSGRQALETGRPGSGLL